MAENKKIVKRMDHVKEKLKRQERYIVEKDGLNEKLFYQLGQQRQDNCMLRKQKDIAFGMFDPLHLKELNMATGEY